MSTTNAEAHETVPGRLLCYGVILVVDFNQADGMKSEVFLGETNQMEEFLLCKGHASARSRDLCDSAKG